MRALSQLHKKKKALSNIIAYVLLISISLSLSIIVYGWLKTYVVEDNIGECSKGVNIIIKNYECYLPNVITNESGRLTVTLKNKGLFTVGGYVLRVHDRPGANFGFYIFDNVGIIMAPGEEYSRTYYFNENIVDGYELSDITFVEIQPFITNVDNVSCKSYSSQEVKCI